MVTLANMVENLFKYDIFSNKSDDLHNVESLYGSFMQLMWFEVVYNVHIYNFFPLRTHIAPKITVFTTFLRISMTKITVGGAHRLPREYPLLLIEPNLLKMINQANQMPKNSGTC